MQRWESAQGPHRLGATRLCSAGGVASSRGGGGGGGGGVAGADKTAAAVGANVGDADA
jgi:hypothetical protein